jgi:catechol 2,3-dioxygenase-like lactoylglutathione lyase family enzyme
MTIAPVHHTVVSVSDLDRSLAFYREVLGFHKVLESRADGYEEYLHLPDGTPGRMVMLAADDGKVGMIELIEWQLPGGQHSTPAKRPGDYGAIMLALEVRDDTLEAITERLTARGHTIYSPISQVELDGYPPFQTMLVEDPDGLLIELIALPTDAQAKAFHAEYKARLAVAGGDGR